MRKTKSTVYDLFTLLVIGGLMGMGMYAAWRARSYAVVGLLGVVELGFLWGIYSMLAQGLQTPTTFERFEGRATVRGWATFIGGGLIFFIGTNWGPFQQSWVIFAFVVVWLVASGLAVRKVRGRHESAAHYKRRTNYREPPEA